MSNKTPSNTPVQTMMKIGADYTVPVNGEQRALMISILLKMPTQRPDQSQNGGVITADEHKALMKALQDIINETNRAFEQSRLTKDQSQLIIRNVRYIMMVFEKFAQAMDIDDTTRSSVWGVLMIMALGLAGFIGYTGYKKPDALSKMIVIILNGMKALLAIGSVIAAGFVGYWVVTELDKNNWNLASTIAEIISDIIQGVITALYDLIKNLVSDLAKAVTGVEGLSSDQNGNPKWYDFVVPWLGIAYVVGRLDGDIKTANQKAAEVQIPPNLVGTRGYLGLLRQLQNMPETGGVILVDPQADWNIQNNVLGQQPSSLSAEQSQQIATDTAGMTTQQQFAYAQAQALSLAQTGHLDPSYDKGIVPTSQQSQQIAADTAGMTTQQQFAYAQAQALSLAQTGQLITNYVYQ